MPRQILSILPIMNIKKHLKLGIHIVFCLSLLFWFYKNSFIRPYAIFHPYKEIVCAFLILLLIYFTYLFLTPYFIRSSNYKNYILLSLIALGVISMTELFLLKTDIIRCVAHDDTININRYLSKVLFLIFLRNSSFYLFFTVLKLFLQSKRDVLSEKKEALKKVGLILLLPLRGKPLSINIDYVSYFSQNKNHTYIHSITGEPVSIYSTLSYMQDYLSNYGLRINRDAIITFTNIVRYNDKCVTVEEDKQGNNKLLYFYKKEANDILATLRKKVPHLEEKNAIFATKIENGILTDDEKNRTVILKKEILEEIKQNPGINAVKIHEKLQKKTSIRTIKRRLKELIDSGFIQFKGADRTGGYHVLSS